MRYVQELKKWGVLLVLAMGAICTVGSQAKADDFNYSGWFTSQFTFGPAGHTYTAVPWKVFTTNPDQARGYFCENFGFFNCQVTPDGNTWLRTFAECWSGAIGSSSSTTIQSDWSTSIPSKACPAGFPNLGTEWIQAASISYTMPQ
jgi:hypothetical protein